ncbi:MAG: Fe-S cluster assembly protein SufD [Pseudomonadota bacterium]
MNDLQKISTPAETALITALETLPQADGWVREARAAAAERFRVTGLPHRRIEDWKYTDLRTLMREVAPLSESGGAVATPEHFADLATDRIVVSDGQIVAGDMPEGVSVVATDDLLGQSDAWLRDVLTAEMDGIASPVLDLNTALMRGGVVIRIAARTELTRPLQIAFVAGGEAEASFVRNVISVGEGAIAPILIGHEGPDGVAYQANTVTHVEVADRARVDLVRLQVEGDQATHLATVASRIAGNAVLNLFTITLGASLSRTQVAFRMEGQHSELRFSGAQLLRGTQHADTTMYVDHREPDCTSRELYKTVLDDKSRGVFQGKIMVHRDAQKTDGRMMSQALMLSTTAEIDNKPELEIYADDVQCGHGATAGQLDDDLMFYLKARGLPPAEAEKLLIAAFIGEAIEGIDIEPLRDAVSGAAMAWLDAR